MQVHQQVSILFYRKRKKANAKGYIPIYCRITISRAGNEEFSTGCMVLNNEWDDENKLVLPVNAKYKVYNKKISQMKTDLERHFDLVVAKNGYALPSEVIASYKAPVFGLQKQTEKKENTLFSLELDELIQKYVKYSRQVEKVKKESIYRNSHLEKLKTEQELLLNELQSISEKAQKIYDNKTWVKTIMLATNYHLLNFLQLVMAEERAVNTLKKLWSTKRRMLEFMQSRYKARCIVVSNKKLNSSKWAEKEQRKKKHLSISCLPG